ncbi:MAG: hypothetical protein AB7J35_03800 [Dehalococcoidia bacterium]
MHLKRIHLPIVLLAVAALAAVTTVWAQTGGGYDASYNGVSDGGQTMSGGGYLLQTSAGQAMAGNSSSGNTYSLDMGVLAGGSGNAAVPTASPSPSASASPSASVTPSGTPYPYKGYGPQVAKDGTY